MELRREEVSDRYGRKRVLLATMIGNIISTVIWLESTSFVSLLYRPDVSYRADRIWQSSFLLSRLVGGLSEGNVQLST